MRDSALHLFSQLFVFINLLKRTSFSAPQIHELGLMITPTLQMKKLKPRGIHKVSEFGDHALNCPCDVVHYSLLS